MTLNYAKSFETQSQKYLLLLLFSCVCLFETSWTTAHQTSLSFIIYWSLLKFMFTKLMMPSNHLKYQNIDILIQAIKATNDILYFIKNSALQRYQ